MRQDIELQYVLPTNSNDAVDKYGCSLDVVPSDLFHVMDTHISHDTKGFQALVNNCSQVTTTNHKFLLHGYKKISFHKYLQDAGKKLHTR